MTTQLVFGMDVRFFKTDGSCVSSRDGALTVPSGTAGTWILRLEVLADHVSEGTTFRLQRYNFQIAHGLQDSHPERRDYTTWEVSSTTLRRLDVELLPKAHGFLIRTSEGFLSRGDTLTFRIGDRRGGGAGSEVFWSATTGRLSLFEENVEENGGASAPAVRDAVIVVTHRDEPHVLRLLAPTVAAPGEELSLHLAVYDINRNPVESFSGTLILELPDGAAGVAESVTLTPEDRGTRVLEGLTLGRPGVYRIGVRLPESGGAGTASRSAGTSRGLSVLSNPIVCRREPGERIFWGDLHAHGWGDSSMLLMHDRTPKLDPASRHEQARRIGRFDYAAVSAMSMPDSADREAIWQAYDEAFRANDEPGRYVPFTAMEMHPGSAGDRVVLFRGRADLPFSCREPVERVYEEYAGREDTVLETHIGGAPPYFEKFKPEEEDLVEVASGFANAEWLLQKLLASGFHPAVTGASDLHLGLMGAPRAVETFRGRFGFADGRLRVRDSGFGSGPVGALVAPRLDREALWAALKGRSGYATTGDRIYVGLDAGGRRMGEAARLPERFPLRLEVHGQEPIERIDLIVGEHLACSWSPGEPDVLLETEFDGASMPPGGWLYFRIRQTNAEYAWTSPIWLTGRLNGGDTAGDADRAWPPWNHTDRPPVSRSAEMDRHLGDLERYLETEGDREAFERIDPVGVVSESMGTSALFVSRTSRERRPVTIRWYFEYEIPKLRVDWGYEAFGVVDCHRGPDV